MVAERLTESDLERSLPEVLERVRGGERFVVERDGQVIAEIVPAADHQRMTLRELAIKLAELSPLDEDFGKDIEEARDTLLPVEAPDWPD